MNWNFVRDLIRSLRMYGHRRRHGESYEYHGVVVTIPDTIDFFLRYGILRGRYEMAEQGLIEKYLPDNLPVIELGGSLGVISRYVSSRLKQDAPLVVVEANPAVFPICRNNAMLPGREAVTTVLNMAVAYSGDVVAFHVDSNPLCSRLVTGAGEDCIMVESCRLHELVDEYAGSGQFVLIMDIEGGEVEVFRNECDALQRCAVAIVELHPSLYGELGSGTEEMLRLACDAGLQLLVERSDVFVFGRSNERGEH